MPASSRSPSPSRTDRTLPSNRPAPAPSETHPISFGSWTCAPFFWKQSVSNRCQIPTFKGGGNADMVPESGKARKDVFCCVTWWTCFCICLMMRCSHQPLLHTTAAWRWIHSGSSYSWKDANLVFNVFQRTKGENVCPPYNIFWGKWPTRQQESDLQWEAWDWCETILQHLQHDSLQKKMSTCQTYSCQQKDSTLFRNTASCQEHVPCMLR